jgi:hypothetical protein
MERPPGVRHVPAPEFISPFVEQMAKHIRMNALQNARMSLSHAKRNALVQSPEWTWVHDEEGA